MFANEWHWAPETAQGRKVDYLTDRPGRTGVIEAAQEWWGINGRDAPASGIRSQPSEKTCFTLRQCC